MANRELRLSMARAGVRSRNWLLAALPDAEYQRLARDLTVMTVDRHQILQHGGEDIRHVYFPAGGVLSMTAALPDGAMIETATIGSEGALGVEAFFRDGATAPGHTIMQVPDGAVARLDVRVFRREIQSAGVLNRVLGRYIPFLMAQTMQVAGCNTLHQIQQRLARWLLFAQDRLDHVPHVRVSHEFLGTMLGTTRPTVSVAAAALRRTGLISYSHGRIVVRDRLGLEGAACPCYTALRAQLTTLRRDLRQHRTDLCGHEAANQDGRIIDIRSRRE